MNTAPRFNTGFASSDIVGSTGYAEAHKVVRDPVTGDFYVAGLAAAAGASAYDMVVTKFNANGQLDTTFGTGGVATLSVIGGSEAYDLALDSSGNLVLSGTANNTPIALAVARLLPDGTLDTSFGGGTGFITETPFAGSNAGDSVIIQPDGKIIVAGNASPDSVNFNFLVMRFNADGTPDTSFGTSGVADIDIGGAASFESSSSAALMNDGRIVVVGRIQDGAEYDSVIVRLNDDGSLDTTFNPLGPTPGILIHDEHPLGEALRSVTVLADGTIVAVGSAGANDPFSGNTDLLILKYNPDNTVETATFDAGVSEEGRSVLVQPDGKILVAGYGFGGPGAVHYAIGRFNSDGTPDTTFGDGTGYVSETLEFAGLGIAYSLALLPSGKIVLSGSNFDGDFILFQLESDGSLDPNFGSASSLDNQAVHTLGGPAVVLDPTVDVRDTEQDAVDDYGASSVVIHRVGGANADDVFDGTGNLDPLADGNDLVLSGNTIGLVDLVGGELVLTFDFGTTRAMVNEVLSSITYAYAGTGTPPSQVDLLWTFTDGDALDPMSVTGTTSVVLSTISGPQTYTFDWSDGETKLDLLDPSGSLTSVYFDATSPQPDGQIIEYNSSAPLEDTVANLITLGGGPSSFSQTDNFVITGTDSGDVITTADGNDIVTPNGGQDYVTTNGGDDVVIINYPANQTFFTNIFDGGSGTDRLEVSGTVNLGGSTGSSGDDNMARALLGFEELRFVGITSNSASIRIPDIIAADGIHLITGSLGLDHLDIGPEPGETFATGLTIDLNILTLNSWNSVGDSDYISITGTNAGDRITGHDGSYNTLYGRMGDDTLRGGALDDAIWGGSGSDWLNGGGGDNHYAGDGGDGGANGYDVVSFSEATTGVTVNLGIVIDWQDIGWGSAFFEDNLEGVEGSSHNDILYRGFATNVTMIGGNGDDLLHSYGGEVGQGFDIFDGGLGIDTLSFETNTVFSGLVVNLATGRASFADHGDDYATLYSIENVIGTDVRDRIFGSIRQNDLQGGSGNDDLFGNAGDDILSGGNGADRMFGGIGADQIYGQVGDNDVAYYSTSAAGVTVNLSTGINTDGDAEGDVLYDIANVYGSRHNDTLTGDALANTLSGAAGEDTLHGGDGADKLYGGNDADTLFGDGGADMLYGNDGDDTLYGNAGADRFFGGNGADEMNGNAGDNDIAYYTSSAVAVTVNLTTNTNTGGEAEGDTLFNIQRVYGSGLGDTLTGDAARNTLYGVNGNDRMDGHTGADILYGGAGSDSFVFTFGASGQSATTLDRIADMTRGAVGVGDMIDFSEDLTIGGSAAVATASSASIDAATGIASFDGGSGVALADALADIATRFTDAGDAAGEFALFQLGGAGSFHMFTSDGLAGVTANDVLIRFDGLNTITTIDLTAGDLTLLA